MIQTGMTTAIQPRTLKTRAKLIDAARAIISDVGYAALRVEQVVAEAGVAKGTFFAHFKDKDALLDRLIGEEIDKLLDHIETSPTPKSVQDIVSALMPYMNFISCERFVFDLVLRHSGAAAIEEIGPIAMTFERFADVIANWIKDGPFRTDAMPEMLANGVHSFVIQAVALNFCAIHQSEPLKDRLTPYLDLWLNPAQSS